MRWGAIIGATVVLAAGGAARADTFVLSCGDGAQTLLVDTRGYVRELRGETAGPRRQAMVSQDEIRFAIDRQWEARTAFTINRRTGLEHVRRYDYVAGHETDATRPCRRLSSPEGYAF
jgi:hypothetical protein